MLKYLLEKEFKQIVRDRFIPKLIFIVPVLQLLILPFAANFEMKNINLAVVDHDRTQLTRQLTEKIVSSGYFNLMGMYPSYQEALASVEANVSDLILEFPVDFTRQLGTGHPSDVLIAANAVNGTKGGLGSSYLSTILAGENVDTGVRVIHYFNPHFSYKSYMVPGIIAFLLAIVVGFVSALNIVREKEIGTIEQINVTPVSKSIFVLSKLIPFWIIGYLLLSISIFIAWLVYGLYPLGGFGMIYLFAGIFLIICTGFGLTISSVSSTQQQSVLTAFFILIIFVLLSGLFTPISSMPEWAQTFTRFNPVRYFVEVMRMVYLKGSTWIDLWPSFVILSLFAVVFNSLALWCYRKSS